MKEISDTSFEGAKSYLSNKDNYNFISERLFSKYFPILYKKILLINFPETFKFSQKLYHFFNNDLKLNFGICPICGKRCVFKSYYDGYTYYCSKECSYKDPKRMEKIFNTNMKKIGVKMASMLPEYVKKQSLTLKEKTGFEYPMQDPNNKQKSIETNLKIRGVKYASQDELVKLKQRNTKKELYGNETYNNHQKASITKKERYGDENYNNIIKNKETCLKKYNVDSYSKTNEFKQQLSECNQERVKKIFETKKLRQNTNTSNVEQQFSQYLTEHNYTFKTNYNTILYPFPCDFYISDLDLYIEIQGFWTHGKHPFNEENIEDIKLVNLWKLKNTPQYKKAIDNWTKRDPLKRKTAKENNINYLEIFSDKINYVISEFEKYIK